MASTEELGLSKEAATTSAREARRRRLLEYREALAAKSFPLLERDVARRRLLVLADVGSFALACWVAAFATPFSTHWYQLVVALALWLALNKVAGIYDWDAAVIDKSTIHELPRLIQSVLVAVLALFVVGPSVGFGVHRLAAVDFAIAALAAMVLSRSFVRMLVLRAFGPERAIVIGSGAIAQVISRKLQTHPHYGAEVVGSVDIGSNDERAVGAPSSLGDLSRLEDSWREQRIERIIAAPSVLEQEDLLMIIRAGRALGLKVTVAPPLFEVLGRSLVVDDVEGVSVLSLRGPARTRGALAVKRAMDIVGAGVGLVVLSPLLAFIALAIKLDSRGPVIFSQIRIGRGNKPFRIRKFRTMCEDADRFKEVIADLNEAELPLLKIPEDRDPRLTRVGRLLRRTMLDELPQLWNVLRGEMSLVGPRPLEPQDDAEVIGWHRARLELTPGLTGPWQALGRHAIPFREMLTLDCLYVADWSLWHDIKLMIRTVRVLLLSHRS